MQLVVVIAVRNAVSAATTTFTATSIILFFILIYLFYVVLLMAFQRHTGDWHQCAISDGTVRACPHVCRLDGPNPCQFRLHYPRLLQFQC